MAGVSAGLLMESLRFAGCSTRLPSAMPGLTFLFLCVSLHISISVKSIQSLFYSVQSERLFHELLESRGVNPVKLCVLENGSSYSDLIILCIIL